MTTQHQAPEVTSDDRELTSAIYRHFGFNGGTNLDLSNPVLQMVAAHRTRATQPLSLTVDEIRRRLSAMMPDDRTLDSMTTYTVNADDLRTLLDRLQSLSGSNCFQNGNSSTVGDGVTKAAADLVAKLDECDPHLTSMFSFALAHNHLYSGPQYGEALEALRAALSGDIDRSGLAQEVES